MTKKSWVLILSAVLVVALPFCALAGGKTEAKSAQSVGVALPTKNGRWIHDGDNLKAGLEKAGYQVNMQFADDNATIQMSQIENMINSGVSALVICPIDPKTLINALQTAADKKIRVISYDRLLMDTLNVDYYITFDNVNVGMLMVAAVAKQQNWDNSPGRTFNVEIFTGDSSDSNAYTAYTGITTGLKPYLDSGKVKILSGQTTFAQVSIPGWSTDTAQKRMENLISGFYSTQKVNAVFTPSDNLSYGITAALTSAGYTNQDWPLVTGQDATPVSVKNMISGTQFLSMFRDARNEAAGTVSMVDAVLKGTTPKINDTKRFNNNIKVVPTYILDATVVTKDNYKALLLDSGYYKAADLQ